MHMKRVHHKEQMPRRHIPASSTSSRHIFPAIGSSRSPQQVSLGGKEKARWKARHTSAHSSSVSAHTVEIFGDVAYSRKCKVVSY